MIGEKNDPCLTANMTHAIKNIKVKKDIITGAFKYSEENLHFRIEQRCELTSLLLT